MLHGRSQVYPWTVGVLKRLGLLLLLAVVQAVVTTLSCTTSPPMLWVPTIRSNYESQKGWMFLLIFIWLGWLKANVCVPDQPQNLVRRQLRSDSWPPIFIFHYVIVTPPAPPPLARSGPARSGGSGFGDTRLITIQIGRSHRSRRVTPVGHVERGRLVRSRGRSKPLTST